MSKSIDNENNNIIELRNYICGDFGAEYVYDILRYLDLQSLINLLYTSFLKSFKDVKKINKYLTFRLLNEKYLIKYPRGTPFIVACEKGNYDDVKKFIVNHDPYGSKCIRNNIGLKQSYKRKIKMRTFFKKISDDIFSDKQNNYQLSNEEKSFWDYKHSDDDKKILYSNNSYIFGLNDYELGKLKYKDMINQEGYDSTGKICTALLTAIKNNRLKVVYNLLKNCKAETNYKDEFGSGLLYLSVNTCDNFITRERIKIIKLLLDYLTKDSINYRTYLGRYTALDNLVNNSFLNFDIRIKISDLIVSKGGKTSDMLI